MPQASSKHGAVTHEVKCMLCQKTTKIEGQEDWPFWLVADMAARNKAWATSRSSKGVFICCPDCYPKAFTLEFGGRVGQLRKKYWKLAVA